MEFLSKSSVRISDQFPKKILMYTSKNVKLMHGFMLFFLLVIQLGCLIGQPIEDPIETNITSTTQSRSETIKPSPTITLEFLPTEIEPENTESATPTPTKITPEESVKIFYNLPPAILVETTGLYASPNRGEYIISVQIPAGETVYVMGRNATSSHLRVVWNTGVGWIPVSFTDYNAATEKLNALPIFKREPPACAAPVTTQFSLDSTWASNGSGKQRIVVVIDLFRSRFGAFPQSSLSLTVNGHEVESSRRQIVEQGQFSLKDVVFSIPSYIQPGDTVGYLLGTTSDEPLAFMATIFIVPDNCVWDTD